MLKDTFCSSPWFHIRINPYGDYLPCRWSTYQDFSEYNVANVTLKEYVNSQTMKDIRMQMLNGDAPAMCQNCYYEDKTNKLNGRQRQLLKSGIIVEDFDKTFCTSPHWHLFKQSYEAAGYTSKLPVDLHLDLGNVCNSACIMCYPDYSSRLAEDYVKLNALSPDLFKITSQRPIWTNNSQLLNKVIDELSELQIIKYLHFLGGETLYLKSFYDICEKLIANGTAKKLTIGTTTNGTVYTEYLEKCLLEFEHVHLGISIESIHDINEYIRWPGQQSDILHNLKKFLDLRQRGNIDISLRITPNVLSIFHIDTIFEFMLENSVIAESCNILSDPRSLRIELLPEDLRANCLDKINKLIDKHSIVENSSTILNRRDPNKIKEVISDNIFEYKKFLENYQPLEDLEEQRYNLVRFLKSFELIRNNSIIDYLPEYEKFLRSYNY